MDQGRFQGGSCRSGTEDDCLRLVPRVINEVRTWGKVKRGTGILPMTDSHQRTGRTGCRPLRPTNGVVAGKGGLQSVKPGRTPQGPGLCLPSVKFIRSTLEEPSRRKGPTHPATFVGSLTTTTAIVKPGVGQSLRVSDRRTRPRNRNAEAATRVIRDSAPVGGVVNMATYPQSARLSIIANP